MYWVLTDQQSLIVLFPDWKHLQLLTDHQQLQKQVHQEVAPGMKEMLGAVEYQVLAAEQLLQSEYHIHIFWVEVESGIIIKIITSVMCLTQET